MPLVKKIQLDTSRKSFKFLALVLLFAIAGTFSYGVFVNKSLFKNFKQTKADSLAGAQLPIDYNLADLTGTKVFVAPSGNDSTGNGSQAAPYATLTKALSVASDGGNIVLRGGTYPISQRTITTVSKSVKIIAYPGEIPLFNGSKQAPGSVSAEGDLRYFSYQPLPAAPGSGLSLTVLPTATFSGDTPTGLAAERGWRCVSGSATYTISAPSACASSSRKIISGFFPDQVWVNGSQLIQVMDKNLVVPGTFYVARDQATDKNPALTNLYIHKDNAADMSKVKVSYSGGAIVNDNSQGDFVRIWKDNVTIEGIKIFGHSPAWDSYVVRLGAFNNVKLKNVEIDSGHGISVFFQSSTNNTLENTSILRSSWMAASGTYADDINILNSKIYQTARHHEITPGPTEGGMKFSKVHGLKIVGSEFTDNDGFGVWCDQSCYGTTVANTKFSNNSRSAFFYEISHDLTFVNNYVLAGSGNDYMLRLAASSGLKIVNNTLVGTGKAIGVMVDGRTKKYDSNSDGTPDRYCSEHIYRYGNTNSPPFTVACINGMDSDLDKQRPGRYGATNQTLGLNFQPSVDMMINNVIALTSAPNSSCSALLCVYGYTNWQSGSSWVNASVMMDTIFHKSRTATVEDPAVGATIMDGNVYQLPSGNVARFLAGTANANFTPVDQRAAASFTANNISSLKTNLANSVYGLSVEATGKEGTNQWVTDDGTPTSLLNSKHSEAAPVPNNSIINQYIPAGTKAYGATYLANVQPPSDTTPPTVSITAPANNSTVSGNTIVTASASDNLGVTKVEFYVDGSLKEADTSAPWDYSIIPSQLTSGNHQLTAKAFDAAGNTKNSDITFIIPGSTTIMGDLNNDAKVNIQDLSILISKWGTNSQPADINKDGIVNIQDLSILLSKWTG